MLISDSIDVSHLHLFYVTVLLSPAFNCCNYLLSSSVDKVATGSYNLALVTENSTPVGALIAGGFRCAFAARVVILVKTQFLDHVKIRFTSQLINGLFKVLQKLTNTLMVL